MIDTNIVLRALHPNLPDHLLCRRLILNARTLGEELWVSRQIIREYLVQVTRQSGMMVTPLTGKEAARQVRLIERLFIVADETKAVTDKLMELVREYPTGGKQIHDANIVATMIVNDIHALMTLNEVDFRRFAPLITLQSLTQ
jgi:predicted nucleic acid-binding protein